MNTPEHLFSPLLDHFSHASLRISEHWTAHLVFLQYYHLNAHIGFIFTFSLSHTSLGNRNREFYLLKFLLNSLYIMIGQYT